MCGVAGFTGLDHVPVATRTLLAYGLGIGVDRRGGHAAGFANMTEEGTYRVHTKLGTWGDSGLRFISASGQSGTCIIHARYATCGGRTVENAHPFTIRRKGKTILYGCHNGMLDGTDVTARRFGRKHTVDSKELFELLADEQYDEIRKLSGYGVITWVVPGSPVVRMLRLNSSADLVVGRLKGGGLVWGSTKSIVQEALDVAEMSAEEVECNTPGIVYLLSPDGKVTAVKKPLFGGKPLTIKSGWGSWSSNYGDSYSGSGWSYGEYGERYTGHSTSYTPAGLRKQDGTIENMTPAGLQLRGYPAGSRVRLNNVWYEKTDDGVWVKDSDNGVAPDSKPADAERKAYEDWWKANSSEAVPTDAVEEDAPDSKELSAEEAEAIHAAADMIRDNPSHEDWEKWNKAIQALEKEALEEEALSELEEEKRVRVG